MRAAFDLICLHAIIFTETIRPMDSLFALFAMPVSGSGADVSPAWVAASVGGIACRQIDEADMNHHDTKDEPRFGSPA